ncbi:MAG: hypothetical protein ACTHPS_16420 [Streptosporangiaceae bacterium]
MPETAAVRSGRRLLTWQRHPAPGRDGRPGWLPVWSVPAWIRALRAVVGDDLADAFRRGAVYLTQAVSWVLGPRAQPPDTAVAAVTAGIRLDEAIRGYLAEQGAKRVTKEDLWSLVMATTRLRLTAHSLASLLGPGPQAGPAGPAAGDGHLGPGARHAAAADRGTGRFLRTRRR